MNPADFILLLQAALLCGVAVLGNGRLAGILGGAAAAAGAAYLAGKKGRIA